MASCSQHSKHVDASKLGQCVLPYFIRCPAEAPAEVRSVEVIRTVGQSSLLIGWERPPLDELGCSNGAFVYGYRVGTTNYVDFTWTSVFLCFCTYSFLSPLRCLLMETSTNRSWAQRAPRYLSPKSTYHSKKKTNHSNVLHTLFPFSSVF